MAKKRMSDDELLDFAEDILINGEKVPEQVEGRLTVMLFRLVFGIAKEGKTQSEENQLELAKIGVKVDRLGGLVVIAGAIVAVVSLL